MANHQNFFSTNLTSPIIAGATTTPLNSIPTCDAPFYLTLDATGLNSHQEVIYCTSKTATNVNHAATTYAHTTAEEVRMDVVADELDVFPLSRLDSKIISITRNLTADTATVAYTGVGFQPSALVIIGSVSGTNAWSVGIADSLKMSYYTGSAGNNVFYSGGDGFTISTAASVYQHASVKSYDANGFTLDWIKVGSPTGSADFFVLCIK